MAVCRIFLQIPDTHSGFGNLVQMEKQVLEQTLQQVLEQPLTHSSPTTSQKSQKSDDDKNPNKEQVQHLAFCMAPLLALGAVRRKSCLQAVSLYIFTLVACMPSLC